MFLEEAEVPETEIQPTLSKVILGGLGLLFHANNHLPLMMDLRLYGFSFEQ